MDVPHFLADYGVFILAMAGAGIFGGLIAGLLGVGGGIVIVPVLYFVLGALDTPEDLKMKIAVATSLATIVVTSMSSARSHASRGAVDYGMLRAWALPVVIGVVIGTLLASFAKGWVLTLIFASVALLVAINMLVRGKGTQIWPDFPNRPVKFAAGGVVGLISSMMGIGGGTLSVPILTAVGYDIRKAVGTASAIGFLIAIPGTIGYVIAGWGAEELPPGSLGYLNLLAFIALVPLTALFAPVGARMAHTIPPRALGYAFGGFLIVTSAKMFGDLVF